MRADIAHDVIAKGSLQIHLKDATYPTPVIMEESSSVGDALMLMLPMVGPKPKKLGGGRFRGGPVRLTSSTSIKAPIRSMMKSNHDTGRT